MPATIIETAVAQEPMALVPLSMSLVAKKEKVLQIEKEKLEKRLLERTKLLCGLRENHEHLLKINGQLQERNRLRREKLLSLRTVLEDEQNLKGADKAGTAELEATAEKCGMLKDLLDALAKKQVALEQNSMNLEERTLRETSALAVKKERLSEARNTLLLQQEDIRSTQWSYEIDKAELANAEMHLNVVNQNARQQSASLEEAEASASTELTNLQDVQMVMQNYQQMAQEELRQLTIANESAKSTQQELRKLLESNGATCPEDDEILEASKDLESTLQRLVTETTSTQYIGRELALRTRQENDIMAITQSAIKAKDEQLAWLERQRVHLENKQREMEEAYAGDEAAYNKFLASHTEDMANLATEIKEIEKQTKVVERSIPTREKKLATINKKIAQKKKALGTWNDKNREKQEQLAKSAETKSLVNSEELALQQELEREQLALESIMQENAVRAMEAEDVLSSCASMEANIRQVNERLGIMKRDITAAETSVKNRVDEIRDKFLSDFVVSDADILIELLDKEVQVWSKKDTDEFDTFEATFSDKAETLMQKYDALMASARSKYSKILQQKKEQYNAKLATLKARTTAKNLQYQSDRASPGLSEKDAMKKSPNRASTMTFELKVGSDRDTPLPTQDSETSLAEFDPPWVDDPSNESVLVKANTKLTSKLQQGQQKAKAAVNQSSKSARRELMSGLNMVDELLTADTELVRSTAVDTTITAADTIRATDSTSSHSQPNRQTGTEARRPRLQRRTAAQKAGKVTKILEPRQNAMVSLDETKRRSPSLPLYPGVSISTTAPTLGKIEDPIDSPNGCDDTIELCRPTQDGILDSAKTALPRKTLDHPRGVAASKSNTTEGPDKTRLKQLVEKRGKKYKRSTAKVAHRRSKTAKTRRISLASQGVRAMDWSTVDTFSFA